jgi:hypothetical protein
MSGYLFRPVPGAAGGGLERADPIEERVGQAKRGAHRLCILSGEGIGRTIESVVIFTVTPAGPSKSSSKSWVLPLSHLLSMA